jgi:cytochrome c
LRAASFGDTSLTQIADPDKIILSWKQNAATPHVCVAAHRTCGVATYPQTTDEPVANLQVYVFAALVFAGSMSAATAQDAALGEKIFVKCRACHQVGEDAKNAVGPVLNGIVGRKAGTYPDYNYSDANKNSGISWDIATLKDYLKNPRAKVPGTKMIFPGLPKDEDIDNVTAYLKQFGADGKKS